MLTILIHTYKCGRLCIQETDIQKKSEVYYTDSDVKIDYELYILSERGSNVRILIVEYSCVHGHRFWSVK